MECRDYASWQLRFFFFSNTLHIYSLGMPEVHLKENWRKSPSWYQTSWRTMPKSERGGRDWDGNATSSLAADAASRTSERVESGVGKKAKNAAEVPQLYIR